MTIFKVHYSSSNLINKKVQSKKETTKKIVIHISLGVRNVILVTEHKMDATIIHALPL